MLFYTKSFLRQKLPKVSTHYRQGSSFCQFDPIPITFFCPSLLSLFFQRHPGAQQFRNAPCLSKTAGRRKGRLRLRHLAHRADAALPQMANQRREQSQSGSAVMKDAQMNINVRADQPGPDGPLMVRAVTLDGIAVEARVIRRVLRTEGAQSHWSEQVIGDLLEHPTRLSIGQQMIAQRGGEELIGTQRGIVLPAHAVHIHNVVEIAAFLIPEASGEAAF